MNFNISRNESAVMKGFAICFIMLHNLLHLVAPLVKENEFTYLYYKAYYMWDHIINLHPNLMGDFFSYFGFYGVPVFMFLSGYGVTMKNESPKCTTSDTSWPHFIGYNFKKLWLLMVPAYLIYIALSFCLYDEPNFTWTSVLAQLTLTSNIVESPRWIDPGVYWYFGLTLQFYLVYRLVFYRKTNGLLWLILLFTFFVQWLAMTPDNVRQQPVLEYLRHNSIGWMLPFVMGIWWARKARTQATAATAPVTDNRGMWAAVFFISVVLLTVCGFQRYLWQLTPLFAVTLSLSFVRLVNRVQPLIKIGVWLGGLSSFIFVTHPLLRPFFLLWIGKNGAPYLECVVYVVCCLAFATLYKHVEQRLVTPLCERIINRCTNARLFQKK